MTYSYKLMLAGTHGALDLSQSQLLELAEQSSESVSSLVKVRWGS